MAARRRKTTKKRTRLGRDSKGRFKKGFYQPCKKGSKIRRSRK